MDVVEGPEGGAIRRNGGFEGIEPQCLVDLNRLTVEGMAAQIPQIGVLEAVGGIAASRSLPPPDSSSGPDGYWLSAHHPGAPLFSGVGQRHRQGDVPGFFVGRKSQRHIPRDLRPATGRAY